MKTNRITFLMVSLFLSTIGVTASESTPLETDITVIDAMPSFWAFWNANSKKTESEQVEAFFRTVVAIHPDLFGGSVLGPKSLTNRSTDPEVRKRIATYLHELAPLIPRMEFLSTSVQRDFPRYVKEFRDAFPEYSPTTPIYFTLSLFEFDAGARIAGDQTALLFGIDGIARIDGPNANCKVIIEHELFHQYHNQVAPALTAREAPLWAYLWEEGLATFVSQQLNPEISLDSVLIIPPNLAEQASPVLSFIARELLAKLDSTNQEDFEAFFSLGGSERRYLPLRSGYYAGYRIASKLAKGLNLREVASLRGVDLHKAIRSALMEFAATK